METKQKIASLMKKLNFVSRLEITRTVPEADFLKFCDGFDRISGIVFFTKGDKMLTREEIDKL